MLRLNLLLDYPSVVVQVPQLVLSIIVCGVTDPGKAEVPFICDRVPERVKERCRYVEDNFGFVDGQEDSICFFWLAEVVELRLCSWHVVDLEDSIVSFLEPIWPVSSSQEALTDVVAALHALKAVH